MTPIQKKYNEVIEEMKVMLDFPWEKPEFYAAWLAQSYYYTSRSSRLLLMAAAHCNMKQSVLHRRLSLHAAEEKGHEILAQRDLKDLGYELKDIPEFSSTTAIYATQFFKVQNESVENFMGWVFPMEGIAISFGAIIRDRLAAVKNANLPTRFLDIHVDEDEDHVESAFKAVQDLLPEVLEGLLQNMDVTKDLYLNMLHECKKRSEKMIPLKKAS